MIKGLMQKTKKSNRYSEVSQLESEIPNNSYATK
jgi:hypothetical protein